MILFNHAGSKAVIRIIITLIVKIVLGSITQDLFNFINIAQSVIEQIDIPILGTMIKLFAKKLDQKADFLCFHVSRN